MKSAFPSSLRLKERSAYNHVFEAPERKSSDGYFTVLGRFTSETHGRIGLVVSKKQVRRAHERNRLKRLARELFRLQHVDFFSPDSNHSAQDVVIIAKHAAQHADNKALFTSLSRHFKRLSTPASKSDEKLSPRTAANTATGAD